MTRLLPAGLLGLAVALGPVRQAACQRLSRFEVALEAAHLHLHDAHGAIAGISTWAIELSGRWWWQPSLAVAIGAGYAPAEPDPLPPELAFARAGVRFWPQRGSRIALTAGLDATVIHFTADGFDQLPPCTTTCFVYGPRYEAGWRGGMHASLTLEVWPLRHGALTARGALDWLPRIGQGGPSDNSVLYRSVGAGLLWRL
jgi:hypothetical protein